MRSSAITALFAAGALGASIHHQHQHAKKDVVVVTDMIATTTTIVWVTAGAAQATAAPSAAPVVPASSSANVVRPQAPASNAAKAQAPAADSSSAASSASSASSSSGSSSGGASIDLGDYQAAVLLHHNIHRANHSAPDVAWDAQLAQIAQDEASVCVYAHNVTGGGGGYGQNIAAGVHPNNISAILTDMFYNGEMPFYAGMYGETNPSFDDFERWGHFSQLVWKGTTHVGCATVDCSASGLANVGSSVAPFFTVCNYGPAGNMGGGYGDNIGEPLGHSTVQWDFSG